jgi:hypothetical protein
MRKVKYRDEVHDMSYELNLFKKFFNLNKKDKKFGEERMKSYQGEIHNYKEKRKMEYSIKSEDKRLLYSGIGLVIISIAFASILCSIKPEISQTTTFIASLVSTAGIALIIIALIEGRYLRNSLKETSEGIVSESATNLGNKFKEEFKILEHCEYNGLIDILAPRQDEDRGNETREIIAKELEKSKSIYVFSISGLDFFGYPRGAGTEVGRYYKVIEKEIEDAKNKSEELELEIKVLLMDPNSNVAEWRDEIEILDEIGGSTQADINTALAGIGKLNKHAEKNFINYCLYSSFPEAGFIITDSSIFIEQYHSAPTQKLCKALREKELKANTLDNNCTGGRVPILRFSDRSNMYVAMKEHFDCIWNFCREQEQKAKNMTK